MQDIVRRYGHLSKIELMKRVSESNNPLAEFVARQFYDIDNMVYARAEAISTEASQEIEERFDKELVWEFFDKVTSLSRDELLHYFEKEFREAFLAIIEEILREVLDRNLCNEERVTII